MRSFESDLSFSYPPCYHPTVTSVSVTQLSIVGIVCCSEGTDQSLAADSDEEAFHCRQVTCPRLAAGISLLCDIVEVVIIFCYCCRCMELFSKCHSALVVYRTQASALLWLAASHSPNSAHLGTTFGTFVVAVAVVVAVTCLNSAE